MRLFLFPLCTKIDEPNKHKNKRKKNVISLDLSLVKCQLHDIYFDKYLQLLHGDS